MYSLILLFTFLIYPYYCHLIGKNLLRFLPCKRKHHYPVYYNILLGLLISNYLLYGLRYCGLTWTVSIIIAWLIPLALWIKPLSVRKLSPPRISYNFIFYTAVNLIIAISIFDVFEGIKTQWVNNYADLPFHLGMITSFTWGENIPPEYHLYPGTKLTYPFIINFWTASFWWIEESWLALKYIFAYQWLFLSTLLFYLLRGNKFKFLPWLIILGGGVYGYFNLHTNQLIGQNLPWTAFLEAIWITQRSALFGTVCLIATASLTLKSLHSKYVNATHLYYAALIILFLPLVHTHSWIIATGLLLLVIAIKLLKEPRKIKALIPILLIIALSGVFVIQLSAKTSAIELTTSWQTSNIESSLLNKVGYGHLGDYPFLTSTFFWLSNCWNIILIFTILAWKSNKVHLFMFSVILVIFTLLLPEVGSNLTFQLSLALGFITVIIYLQSKVKLATLLLSIILLFFTFANTLKLSYWPYDQIKIFIPIYILLILSWQMLIPRRSKLNLFLLVLIVPGAVRFTNTIYNKKPVGVYSESDLKIAEKIRSVTNSQDIIAAEPQHNSLITLTGRKLYLGYTATLWSHGIEYQERETALKNILTEKCTLEVCPNYLYYPPTSNYWERKPIDQEKFEKISDNLYKIKKN